MSSITHAILCLNQVQKVVQIVRELPHQLFHVALLESLGCFGSENLLQMASDGGAPPRSACPDEQCYSTH